jgi:hypothetical protein
MNTEAVCGLQEELVRILEIHENYLIEDYRELALLLGELGYPISIDQAASLCRTLLEAGLLEHREDDVAQNGLFRVTPSASSTLTRVYTTRN